MTMLNRKTFAFTATVALILGLGIWLSFFVTWKEEEIDIGYSKEAAQDPFLAIKRFLAQQHVESQTLRSFTMLDTLSWQNQPLGTDDTLILFNAHKMLHGERLDNLLAWVERGGRVIVPTKNPLIGNTDTPDPLLEYFELEVQDSPPPVDGTLDEPDEGDSEEELYDEDPSESFMDFLDEMASEPADSAPDSDTTMEESLSGEVLNDNQASTATEATEALAEGLAGELRIEKQRVEKQSVENQRTEKSGAEKQRTEEDALPENHVRCHLDSAPLAVAFVDEREPLLIDYSQGLRFDFYGAEPRYRAGDDHGLHLAQFDWGEGSVIINSDNRIWENERVDCHDHAYALWQLINPHGKVWFLMNQEAPSLWTMLWRASPYGALAAFLASALWLWASAARFGPILTRASSGRRSLAEHIHASAMLLWRRQEHPYLVALLRDDLRQQLQQHYPQFPSWSEQAQIAHLQAMTSLTATQLHQALFSDKLLYPQDFTEAVACLQTIRKNL